MTFFRTMTMSQAYDTVYESRLPIIDGLLYPEIYLYVNEIRYGLEQKLEAMVRHEWYAKYKTALPRKNEKLLVSVIWMSVEFLRVSAGQFLLGRDDRSVPRSCE